MSTFLRLAFKAAKKSTHRQHALGAVVVKGGAVISCTSNTHKWVGHAERRALRPNSDYEGATIYVVRSNGGCSKPCGDCMRAIKEAGIKNVVYIESNWVPVNMKVA